MFLSFEPAKVGKTENLGKGGEKKRDWELGSGSPEGLESRENAGNMSKFGFFGFV